MSKAFDPEHSANQPAGDFPPLSSAFNSARHADAAEIELKFLVTNDHQNLFGRITAYFDRRDWVRFRREDVHLITRQLDTEDRSLFGKNTTLRMRAKCKNNNLEEAEAPDICVKTGSTRDESGAVRRGEYEARIPDFERPDIWALASKYPKSEHPELHEVIRDLRIANLIEYFRIDCRRKSYLIELPEAETGLKGKRLIAELELDDVVFLLDLPDCDQPIIFHYDREIEAEVRMKPCEYTACDPNLVSSPLTAEEIDQGLKAVRRHIVAAAGANNLAVNYESKAERGFKYFDRAEAAWKRRAERHVQSASESFNYRHTLPHDRILDIIRNHGIATYRYRHNGEQHSFAPQA